MPVSKLNRSPDDLYGPWSYGDAETIACAGAPDLDKCIWYDFARHYDLVGATFNPDFPEGDPDRYRAAYQAKTIFFLKDCANHPPQGVTGGENFGILAEIPVLVD